MRPLEGVKVIDLTTFVAAPAASRLLGEWGADCIKVEAPKGDPARTQTSNFGMPYDDDENLGFDMGNLNKRFISIDLKSEAGHKIMDRLLAEADVLVTNMRTKALQRMGMDYESLKDRYPHLIYAHCLGYGEAGPEKDSPGFDMTCYMARGGILGTTVNAGSMPMVPVNGLGDFQLSACLAAGICAALYNRGRTGKGDYTSVSLHHVAAYMLSTAVVSAQYGNKYPKDRGQVICPTINVYQTKDKKWVSVCAAEYDKYYNKIVTVMGRPDLVDHPVYSSCDRMNAAHCTGDIIAVIDEAAARYTRDEFVRLLKDNELPCEACYEPTDMYEDEQVWANDIMVKLDCPSGQRNIATGPVRFKSNPLQIWRSSAQGTHTEEVLKELGYTEEECRELFAQGAAVGKTALKKG